MSEYTRWQIETLRLTLPAADDVIERLSARQADPDIAAILDAYRGVLGDRAELTRIALDNADRAAHLRMSNGHLIAQEARLQQRIAELERKPEPEPAGQLELL